MVFKLKLPSASTYTVESANFQRVHINSLFMPKPTKARASFVAGSGTKCPRELAEPVQLIRIAPESNTLVVSSVQACTKGIWIWGAPIHHEAGAAARAINSGAMDQLSLVVQLIKRIRVNAEDAEGAGGALLAEHFPQFVWLLRDFQLDLLDEAGRPISEDEYLEDCLRQKPGSSAAVREQNETRAGLTALFRHRSCIALPHPTLGTPLPPEALKTLGDCALAELAPAFQHGVGRLQAAVVGAMRSKSLHGTKLDGRMLVGLAEAYVRAINDGALPTISTAWAGVVAAENERALKAATQLDAALRAFRAAAVGEAAAGFEEQLREAVRAEGEAQRLLLAARSEALCTRYDAAAAEVEALPVVGDVLKQLEAANSVSADTIRLSAHIDYGTVYEQVPHA
ncbi:hypothetical protein EMIHUDRAFT_229564 [Emiliania huxleyi CCMP1516]|uniref:GB1/RHD3-type G domain-containing protein n=2 Tax=Emiliania huxleyi TaxID=2903 RepID=A0A0D3KCX1_EMIH1|nr:hypothetical protein EMIHUDRAFT_229564 [Emiliania huxleyi CCMP1516]EOD33606.1 hypothetical protein EMIHUDRAFT_229564 [Emiliania huxleyi CCMP1516]|eukprot:XP_005786035.1 hypothetical protein EMIHUDRAFT_229564 [Emiliania huxleyi CCMP1516]